VAPLAVIVTACPLQDDKDEGTTLRAGDGSTVMVLEAEAEQPGAEEPVTVYVVVAAGLTSILLVVAPVFH